MGLAVILIIIFCCCGCCCCIACCPCCGGCGNSKSINSANVENDQTVVVNVGSTDNNQYSNAPDQQHAASPAQPYDEKVTYPEP